MGGKGDGGGGEVEAVVHAYTAPQFSKCQTTKGNRICMAAEDPELLAELVLSSTCTRHPRFITSC